MQDAIYKGTERIYRVDAHPDEMRRIEIKEEAEGEHPLPELRRVSEVSRIPVGVPALHDAVLHHDRYALLPGALHQRRERAAGLAQVLGDGFARVTADERAHRRAPERRRRVDAGRQVLVDAPPGRWVRVQVVFVVRERGDDETVPVEGVPHFSAVERGHVQMTGGEGPV